MGRGKVVEKHHPRGCRKMAERAELEAMETSSTGASRAMDDIGLAMSERPTCILCLGMAGSGKTTFVQVDVPGICKLILLAISQQKTYQNKCPAFKNPSLIE